MNRLIGLIKDEYPDLWKGIGVFLFTVVYNAVVGITKGFYGLGIIIFDEPIDLANWLDVANKAFQLVLTLSMIYFAWKEFIYKRSRKGR